ncbi:MAG: zinc ribbon domain-containing protein [Acidobacteria bacterium]|nr:zinc ribbon domain-containing protein [Acidobacteriota bacterium]
MPSTTDAVGEGSPDGLLRPWQFFLLAGMLGATATVIVATGQTPASIVLLSLTVIAAAFAGLGLYRTLLPLVSAEGGDAPTLIGGRTRAALEREKLLVLRAIKELEFDHAMGKVAKADFEEMGARLRSRAIGLLQKLEDGNGYRAIVERELQMRLAGRTAAPGGPTPAESPGRDPGWGALEPPPQAESDAVEGDAAAEAEARASTLRSSVQACASCGVENDSDARFCKRCGTKLSAGL